VFSRRSPFQPLIDQLDPSPLSHRTGRIPAGLTTVRLELDLRCPCAARMGQRSSYREPSLCARV